MSIILDALKQAEREHQVQEGRVLNAIYMEESARHPRRGTTAWIILGFLAAALVIVMLSWPESIHDLPQNRLDQVMDFQPQAIKKEGPEKTTGRRGSRVTPREVVNDQAGMDHLPKIQTARSDKEPLKGKKVLKDDGKNITYPSTARNETAVVTMEQVKNMMLTRSETTESSASAIDSSTPMIDDLPPETLEKFPKIKIMAHGYHEDPSRCFAFINGQIYRIGDRIGTDGPILKEITPDGVIIDYGTGQAQVPIK